MNRRRSFIGSLLLLFAVALVPDAQAGWRRLYAQYNNPARRGAIRTPSTNRPAPPKSTQPVDKPQQFRELAIGTQFYYVADRDRKLFPYKKVSATYAQPLSTASGASTALVAVPGESMVIAKKDPSAPKPADKTNAQPTKATK